MTSKFTKPYICIHGHFYQPPRENPWLGAIETQPGAAPFHDWNERITAECYRPNAAARIVDSENRILAIRNNYERISFNFGPTLLTWLELHAPDTYQAILDADRHSAAARRGHGNAIAQVYNHIIMPLASARDKRTQILWGLEDFRARFRRDPEGMWLAETAVDLETLALLAEYGIRFTILAPSQAARFRGPARASRTASPAPAPAAATSPAAPRTAHWTENSAAHPIDTTRPYLCHLPGGRQIALFFYDGPISQGIAFEGLLNQGERLARRLLEAFHPERHWPQLIHAAADGETYGHHHRFGEMALLYGLHLLETRGEAILTNYAEFLDLFPPEAEVEIREATSWSCAHGVERWRSDCGCCIQKREGWSQKWRGPLRKALEILQARLDTLFETETAAWLRDPWAARDDYIQVMLKGQGGAAFRELLRRHAREGQEAAEIPEDAQNRLLALLEAQRYSLYMFTSCGWFFDEVSGIETVQNLLYAARALQIARRLGADFHEEFFDALAETPSNIYPGGGREVWQKLVAPVITDLDRVIANIAIIRAGLEDPGDFAARFPGNRFYGYKIRITEARRVTNGGTSMETSRIRVSAPADGETAERWAAALHLGAQDFHCALCPVEDLPDFTEARRELETTFRRHSLVEVFRILDTCFPPRRFDIHDLFAEQLHKVLSQVTREAFESFRPLIHHIYRENRKLMEFVRDLKGPIPAAFAAAAQETLQWQAERAVDQYLATGDRSSIDMVVEEATGWDVKLASREAAERLQAELDQCVKVFHEAPSEIHARDILRVLDVIEALRIEKDIHLWTAQTILFMTIYNTNGSPWGQRETNAPAESNVIVVDDSSTVSHVDLTHPLLRIPAIRDLARRLRISTDSPLMKPSPQTPPPSTRSSA